MSSLAHPFVSWTEFVRLPERPDGGKRYELHDGEVVVVPPARPLHIKLQKRIEQLLQARAGEAGVVTMEFPYRPAPNLQYWFADVAFVRQADWDSMPPDEYPVYTPPLVIEVLSPSNTPAKLNRQRVVAMSPGTQEFWVVDPDTRTVHVTDLRGSRTYASGEAVPLAILSGATVAVDRIFTI
ncbi:MAG: Uma2 family endonuclease [Bryobacteraceae bacterium]